ncbi:MAG: hypothetical protein WC554_09740 [Clostridia bacterium]|jgi:hypothetical protein
MKQNPNKYYVSVEDTVYSLTAKQYAKVINKLENARRGFDKDKNAFYEALDYITEIGIKVLVIDESHNY